MTGSGGPASPASRLGAAGLVALLVLSVALGIYVYRARTPDLALEVTKFPNEFAGRPAVDIEFFVRFDSADATVEIVARNQELTRTLAESVQLEAEQPVKCVWDGLDDNGDQAEPGRYRLRVTIPEEDRVMVFPERVDIDEKDAEIPSVSDEGTTPLIGDVCEQGDTG